MEIINFLEKGEKLTSKPVIDKSFKEKYNNQNGGILCEDIMKLIKRFNRYCVLVHSEEEIFTGNTDFIITDDEEHHSYYIHINYERHKFEKYDNSHHTIWSNNCTLYACICACVRPYRSGKQTMEIIKNIKKEQWYELSKHFFNRDKKWFYPIKDGNTTKKTLSGGNTMLGGVTIKQLSISTHDIYNDGILRQETSTNMLTGGDCDNWKLDDNTFVKINGKELPTLLLISGFRTLFPLKFYENLFKPTTVNYVVYNWIDDIDTIFDICTKYKVTKILTHSLGGRVYINSVLANMYPCVMLDPPFQKVPKKTLEEYSKEITKEICQEMIDEDVKAIQNTAFLSDSNRELFQKYFLSTFTIDSVRDILIRQISQMQKYETDFEFIPTTECHQFIAMYPKTIPNAIVHKSADGKWDHNFFKDLCNCDEIWKCY